MFGKVQTLLGLLGVGYKAIVRRDEGACLQLLAEVAHRIIPKNSRAYCITMIAGRMADPKFLQGEYYAAYKLLARLGESIYPEYQFIDLHLDWWSDLQFKEFSKKFNITSSMSGHRKWAVWQLMRLVSHLPGDTAECGVYQGATSWIMCKANLENSKVHHMFDSFEGLSQPSRDDGTYWKGGELAVSVDAVRANLSEFDRVRFYKGWIPQRFKDLEGQQFSFVHIDVDLYQPTYDSLAFFYPRLVPGGIIVCDDFGFGTCPGATRACNEFLDGCAEKMISLADGGGFLIKGILASRAESKAIDTVYGA